MDRSLLAAKSALVTLVGIRRLPALSGCLVGFFWWVGVARDIDIRPRFEILFWYVP